MSSTDRLLIPSCICGNELHLSSRCADADETIVATTHVTTHVRIYKCADCGHEMRIIVWGDEATEFATQFQEHKQAQKAVTPNPKST